MKLFVPFCLLLLCSIQGASQKAPVLTTVEEMGLKGKVKYIRDSTFVLMVVENKKVWVPIRVNVTWFDNKGNKESTSSYNEKGELTYKTGYTYNQLGLLTGFISEDKNNKQLQQMVIDYDQNNLPIQTKDFNEEKKLAYQTNLVYKVIEGGRTELKYRNGKLIDSCIVLLNSDNTVKSKTWYANNKVVAKEENRYANGIRFPLEKKSEYGGRICNIKYDSSGNMLEYNCENGFKETYTYVFNKLNNWIEYVKYTDGEPSLLQTRKITYYSTRANVGSW